MASGAWPHMREGACRHAAATQVSLLPREGGNSQSPAAAHPQLEFSNALTRNVGAPCHIPRVVIALSGRWPLRLVTHKARVYATSLNQRLRAVSLAARLR